MVYASFAAFSRAMTRSLQPGACGTVRQRRLAWGALAATALALAGCSSGPPKPVVSDIQVTLVAGADVNPDTRKRASPVTVRVYALKSAAPFEAADFFSLFDKDTATLGGELVQREEALLRPGEQKALPPMKFGPEVKSIAVMAAFRDLERARWRAVHMIDIGKGTDLKVMLNASQIVLQGAPLVPPKK